MISSATDALGTPGLLRRRLRSSTPAPNPHPPPRMIVSVIGSSNSEIMNESMSIPPGVTFLLTVLDIADHSLSEPANSARIERLVASDGTSNSSNAKPSLFVVISSMNSAGAMSSVPLTTNIRTSISNPLTDPSSFVAETMICIDCPAITSSSASNDRLYCIFG